MEQYCAVGTIWTYNARDKEGNPTYGGYSERIVVNENYGLGMPENLPLEACAPLLCAGITLYPPLRHWGAGPEVTVLSQSLKKQADGKRLGADHIYAPLIPRHSQSSPSILT